MYYLTTLLYLWILPIITLLFLSVILIAHHCQMKKSSSMAICIFLIEYDRLYFSILALKVVLRGEIRAHSSHLNQWKLMDSIYNFTNVLYNPANQQIVPLPKQNNFIKISFHISKADFKYLGLDITHNIMEEFLPHLLSDLNFQRWDILHLTFADKVNWVKMNVLPRFLFLVHYLAIYPLKSPDTDQCLGHVHQPLPMLWAHQI